MRTARVIFCFVIAAVFLLQNVASVFAQTSSSSAVTTTTTVTNSYAAPNMDPNVPRNQHTFAQAVTIEVLSAVMCQLTGIDPVDPSSPCLGINPQTNRLGYAPTPTGQNGTPQIGGLLGFTTHMIAYTYQPVVSTDTYTQYLSDNFGIVKKAQAASFPDYGFQGLRPVLDLWVSVRNIAYILLVLAFIVVGVGVMLRVKIDPRTVMTVQNQIPKIIIAIILITFSYAIAAILVDVMWVSTYAGINLITNSSPQAQQIDAGEGSGSIQTKGSNELLQIPFYYANGIFHTGKTGGIVHLTASVSDFIGSLLQNVVGDVFNIHAGAKCFGLKGPSKKAQLFGILSPAIPFLSAVKNSIPNPGQCIADFFGWLSSIVAELVIFVVIVVALFKIWFNLIKAYIYTLLYIIVSPVMIVFGLLPSKPMGFENWLRRLFVNLAVFPLTAFMIVGARVLMDVYNTNTSSSQFIPPLIGSNQSSNFGALLAFGALLITPHIQTILQEKMGVKGIGSPGLLAAGIAGGASVIGAPVGRAMKHLNRTDSNGQALGALARFKRESGNKALDVASRSKINPFRASAARQLAKREALQNRSPHESAGQVLSSFNRDNPGFLRSRFNPRNRKNGTRGGGSTTGGTASSPNQNITENVVMNLNSRLAPHMKKPGIEAHVQQRFADLARGTSLEGHDMDPKNLNSTQRATAKLLLDKIHDELKKANKI